MIIAHGEQLQGILYSIAACKSRYFDRIFFIQPLFHKYRNSLARFSLLHNDFGGKSFEQQAVYRSFSVVALSLMLTSSFIAFIPSSVPVTSKVISSVSPITKSVLLKLILRGTGSGNGAIFSSEQPVMPNTANNNMQYIFLLFSWSVLSKIK